jgi:hypothetical protein
VRVPILLLALCLIFGASYGVCLPASTFEFIPLFFAVFFHIRKDDLIQHDIEREAVVFALAKDGIHEMDSAKRCAHVREGMEELAESRRDQLAAPFFRRAGV